MDPLETAATQQIPCDAASQSDVQDIVVKVNALVSDRPEVIRALIQSWGIDATLTEVSDLQSNLGNQADLQVVTPGLGNLARMAKIFSGRDEYGGVGDMRRSVTSVRWSRMQHRTKAHIRIPVWFSHLVLDLFCMTLLVTTFFSYWMSIGMKRVSADDFFISSSIDLGLPHRIGGLGFDVTALLLIALAFIRFVAVTVLAEPMPHDVQLRILRSNRIAFVATFVSSIAGMGVAAFNVSFNVFLHLFFAWVFFSGLVLACALHTYSDAMLASRPGMHGGIWGIPAPSRRWLRLHLLLNASSTVALVGSIYFGEEGDMQQASACELLAAFCIVIYFLSWNLRPGTGYAVAIDLTAIHRINFRGVLGEKHQLR